MFTEEEAANETRGQWCAWQLLGSSNIHGSPLLYALSGHLSHPIERMQKAAWTSGGFFVLVDRIILRRASCPRKPCSARVRTG